MITTDQLKDEVIMIAHHVDDALKYLKDKRYNEVDASAVEGSLKDIGEVVERLKEFLPSKEINEIDRIAGEVEPTP